MILLMNWWANIILRLLTSFSSTYVDMTSSLDIWKLILDRLGHSKWDILDPNWYNWKYGLANGAEFSICAERRNFIAWSMLNFKNRLNAVLVMKPPNGFIQNVT